MVLRSEAYHISRDEPFPYFFEDADFLIETIKASIREGELKANRALQKMELNKRN
jgi:NTE family protein